MAKPGEMRERPTFQQRGLDDNGEPTTNADWQQPGLTVWAQVTPLKGGEPVMQQRLQGTTPVQVTIRYSSETSEITNAWRMVWKGVPFNIKSVSPDERRAYIAILATADQSDG